MTYVIHLPHATASEEAQFNEEIAQAYDQYLAALEDFEDNTLDWQAAGAAEHEYELALATLERVWDGGPLVESDPALQAEDTPADRMPTAKVQYDFQWGNVFAVANWCPTLPVVGCGYEICWDLAVESSAVHSSMADVQREERRFALQARRALKLLFLDLEDDKVEEVYCFPADHRLSVLYRKFGFTPVAGDSYMLKGNVTHVLDRLIGRRN